MKYQHIYNPVALVEYKEAIVWYKNRSILAAENFAKEVTEKKTPLRNTVNINF